MKKCSRCGNPAKEGDYYCASCRRDYAKEHYQKNKEKYVASKKSQVEKGRSFIWGYLSTHPCVLCGEEDPLVLEFDHLQDKEFCISRGLGDAYSIDRLQKEIEKCQVLCANCHKRKTARDQGWYTKQAPMV